MAAPERFSVLAALPPLGGFRRVLALDRAGAARAVVLSFPPAPVADDPARLAAVLRDAEAAARLHHPGAAPVLGTETVDGELAIVELHRPGASLRALLDAGGRLPPDVAARALIDACAAVARAHGIDAGDGRRLAHGAIAPARIVVGEDGASFVSGLGLGVADGSDAAADVRALGAALFECLAGEPPGEPPRRLDLPGVPPALAAAVDRATGAAGEPFPSADALANAIAAAVTAAPHRAVAAYADAVLPEDEGERAELRRTLATALGATAPPPRRAAGASAEAPEPKRAAGVAGDALEVSAELIVEPTDPAVARTPPSVPTGMTSPPRTVDAVGTFPKPPPPERASRVPAAVAAVLLAAGFAVGFSLSRAPEGARVTGWLRAATSTSTSTPAATATRTATATPAAAHTRTAAAVAPAPPAGERDRVRGPSRAKRPARGASRAAGKGTLDVSAPDDAEVLLDGRRVGRGNVRVEIPEGAHRIEVRRAGATVAERFSVEPGETWTYTVTPTP